MKRQQDEVRRRSHEIHMVVIGILLIAFIMAAAAVVTHYTLKGERRGEEIREQQRHMTPPVHFIYSQKL